MVAPPSSPAITDVNTKFTISKNAFIFALGLELAARASAIDSAAGFWLPRQLSLFRKTMPAPCRDQSRSRYPKQKRVNASLAVGIPFNRQQNFPCRIEIGNSASDWSASAIVYGYALARSAFRANVAK